MHFYRARKMLLKLRKKKEEYDELMEKLQHDVRKGSFSMGLCMVCPYAGFCKNG